MNEITLKTEWLDLMLMADFAGGESMNINLFLIIRALKDFAKYGDELTEDDLKDWDLATKYAYNTIMEGLKADLEAERMKAEADRANKVKAGQSRGKQKQAEAKQRLAEVSRTKQVLTSANKEKEEREENKEENREESEEVSPHTPLQEDKEESKGETREEREERETRACARESETALSIFADALPAPQFVPESDPHKLTDKGLEQEFEALWLLFPRKAGKADALRHYKAARKNGTSYDEVEQGIIRYTRHIEDEQTDPQYIAMGSTWFCGHRWEDVYARHGPKPGSFEWIAQL